MPLITDWLMFGITAIYVIATIFICKANIKSANATRDQIAESQRQFNEENRPIIEVEFCYERRQWYIIRLKNNGKLTANKVKVELSQEFIDSLPEESFRKALEKCTEKECIIGVGQCYDLFIGSNKLRENQNMKPVVGKITYVSNNREFVSDVFVDLSNYMNFYSSDTDQSDLIKAINSCTKELKNISNTISTLKEFLAKKEEEDV